MSKRRAISDRERLYFLIEFNSQFVEETHSANGWMKVRTHFFPYTIEAIDAAIRAARRGGSK